MKSLLIAILFLSSLTTSYGMEEYDEFKDKQVEFAVTDGEKDPSLYIPDPEQARKRQKAIWLKEQKFSKKMAKTTTKILAAIKQKKLDAIAKSKAIEWTPADWNAPAKALAELKEVKLPIVEREKRLLNLFSKLHPKNKKLGAKFTKNVMARIKHKINRLQKIAQQKTVSPKVSKAIEPNRKPASLKTVQESPKANMWDNALKKAQELKSTILNFFSK